MVPSMSVSKAAFVTVVRAKDGNESDSHGIGSGYHQLPHFNSNTDLDIFEYEYKTDVSDSNFDSNIYSSQLKIYY